MVGSSNLNTSRAFYDEVLAVLGMSSMYEDEVCIGYAHEGNADVESVSYTHLTLPTKRIV